MSAREVSSPNSVGDIAPRVRHLETEVGELKREMRENTALLFNKLDKISGDLAETRGRKTAGWVPFAGLAIQGAMFMMVLTAGIVGTITFVASSANNGVTARTEERIRVMAEDIAALKQNAGWAPRPKTRD